MEGVGCQGRTYLESCPFDGYFDPITGLPRTLGYQKAVNFVGPMNLIVGLMPMKPIPLAHDSTTSDPTTFTDIIDIGEENRKKLPKVMHRCLDRLNTSVSDMA
jgi:hypothetical protein